MDKILSKIILFVSIFGGLSLAVRGQQEVNVNPAKGVLSVNIPIHKFDMLDFEVELGFSYVAKGYQPANSSAQYVGLAEKVSNVVDARHRHCRCINNTSRCL